MSSSYFLKRMAAGVWPAAVALVIALAHIPEFLHRLLDGDEAIYGTVAVLMNAGGSLYGAGGVDNKPPGIFWVYSLTFRMFGDYQMTAVHAAGFLAMAATCFLLFMITRDLAGRRAGLLAALFYGILTAAGNPRPLASNTNFGSGALGRVVHWLDTKLITLPANSSSAWAKDSSFRLSG